MSKVLSIIPSAIFWFNFCMILAIFHPIQIICRGLGGYALHKKSIDLYNCLIHYNLWFLGSKLRFQNDFELPIDRPLIIVANHQSTFDIPALIWFLRKHHVKFAAKKKLEKGYPTISYTLRHNGSVFVDLDNPRKGVIAIKKIATFIEQNNYAAVIFPEGARARDGKMFRFQKGGLKALFKYAPSALVVPIALQNLNRVELQFPMNMCEKLSWKVLQPIEIKKLEPDDLILEIENNIRKELNQELLS